MRAPLTLLFEWWCDPAHHARPDIVAADVQCSTDLGLIPLDEWLWLAGQQPTPEEVNVIGIVADERSGAIFFEWRDMVTLLKHRDAWWIEGCEGRITVMVTTSSRLPE